MKPMPKQKLEMTNIFRLEIAYLCFIISVGMLFNFLYSFNYSLTSYLKAPFEHHRIIHIDKVVVKTGMRSNLFFEYKGNQYRAPCYIEVARYICVDGRTLHNIKVLEPFPNAREVLVVAGEYHAKSFSIPEERQMDFVQSNRFFLFIFNILIILMLIYMAIYIIMKKMRNEEVLKYY